MGRVSIKTKRRYAQRRIVAALIAIFLIGFIIFAVVKTQGYTAIASSDFMALEQEYNAIIVRDEVAVTAPRFERADYMVREGEYIEAGTHVMDVYKSGFSDELLIALQQTTNEIYSAQLELLGETKDTTLTGYNEAVAALEKRIAYAAMEIDGENAESVIDLELQLREVLNERTEYLKENLQQTETLRKLYAKEAEQIEVIEKWRSSLIAETSGTISFYFDDYENALNEDKLSIITSDIVRSAINKRTAVSWTTKSETLAYKLVDTSEWYCVYLTRADEALRSAGEHRYNVEIKGYGEYQAVALDSVVSGDYAVNILKITADMGELINIRNVKLRVEYAGSGTKIETRGIINKNDGQFIIIDNESADDLVEIKVLAADKKYAIIEASEDSSNITSEVKYWVPKMTLIDWIKSWF